MHLDENQQHHGEFLLNVGDGIVQTNDIHGSEFIQLPDEITGPTSLDQLITSTYGEDLQDVDLSNRAIFTPKNEDVTDINRIMTDLYPGEVKHYLSADSVTNTKANAWPIEFLNKLTPNSIPPHNLALKEGILQ